MRQIFRSNLDTAAIDSLALKAAQANVNICEKIWGFSVNLNHILRLQPVVMVIVIFTKSSGLIGIYLQCKRLKQRLFLGLFAFLGFFIKFNS